MHLSGTCSIAKQLKNISAQQLDFGKVLLITQ